VGKVDAWKLRPLLGKFLHLPSAAAEPLPLSMASIARRSRFTPQADPAAELVVQKHMDTIAAAIQKRVGSVEAIVLTGSFGRGEGGVYQDDTGAWRPVNDYDIFVVSPKNCSGELKELSETLVKELGLDYLDLGWTDGQWKHRPLTVANYDLKFGSQVIAGDAAILNRLPAYASAELPIYEAAKLLLNRTAGLLTGLRGDMLGAGTLSADQRRYLSNQIAKAQMALGDSYLIRWGGYDASYRLRRERFAALAPGAGLSRGMTAQVIQGYDFKLRPDYSIYAHPLETIRQLRPYLETAVIEIVNQMGNGKTKDLAGAMALYLATMSEDSGWVQSDNAFFLGQPSFRNLLQTPSAATVSLRHLVYSALPELLAAAFAASGAEGLLESTRRMLASHFQLPEKATAHPVAWESLRATTVTAWFAVHH
jgi:predicted nucleotidyltransferase